MSSVPGQDCWNTGLTFSSLCSTSARSAATTSPLSAALSPLVVGPWPDSLRDSTSTSSSLIRALEPSSSLAGALDSLLGREASLDVTAEDVPIVLSLFFASATAPDTVGLEGGAADGAVAGFAGDAAVADGLALAVAAALVVEVFVLLDDMDSVLRPVLVDGVIVERLSAVEDAGLAVGERVDVGASDTRFAVPLDGLRASSVELADG